MARQRAGARCTVALLLAALGCNRVDVSPRPAPPGPGAMPAATGACADAASEALAAHQAGDSELAIRIALDDLAREPDSERLHALLVHAYLERGRAANALLRLAPASAEAHERAGLVHLHRRDFAAAAAEYEAALRIAPQSAPAHLGAMWRRKLGGSLEEAAQHAGRALALGADRWETWDGAGETWEALGEDARALAVYEQGRALLPGARRLEMRLAILRVRLRDDARAAEHLARAGTAARDPRLASRLAIAWAARGEYARAEPIFRELAARAPESGARAQLARLLRETGRAAEAQRLLDSSTPPAAPALGPLLDGLAPLLPRC